MGLADQAAGWRDKSRGADRGGPRQLLRDGARTRPRRRGRIARAVGHDRFMHPRRGRRRTADHQRRPVVRAVVPGLDAGKFEQMVGRAEELCPVSNALHGNVRISVAMSSRVPGRRTTGRRSRVRSCPTVFQRSVLIEPSAPFRLDLTVWALRRRSHNTVDRWDASTYTAAPCRSMAGLFAVGDPGRRRDGSAPFGRGQRRPRRRARRRLARNAVDTLLGLSVDLSAFAAMAMTDPLSDRWPSACADSSHRAFRPCSRRWSTASPASSCPSPSAFICSTVLPLPTDEAHLATSGRAGVPRPGCAGVRPAGGAQAPRLQHDQGAHDH